VGADSTPKTGEIKLLNAPTTPESPRSLRHGGEFEGHGLLRRVSAQPNKVGTAVDPKTLEDREYPLPDGGVPRPQGRITITSDDLCLVQRFFRAVIRSSRSRDRQGSANGTSPKRGRSPSLWHLGDQRHHLGSSESRGTEAEPNKRSCASSYPKDGEVFRAGRIRVAANIVRNHLGKRGDGGLRAGQQPRECRCHAGLRIRESG